MKEESLRVSFEKKGYFKLENFFNSDVITYLKKDIEKIVKKKPENVIFYKDRKNLLRRMERFHNYTNLLKEINIKILHFLNKIFGQKFYLFKDKCNFKPSGGEGFYAHYDGIFQWVDKNRKIRKGWHDYASEFINILILLDDFRENNGPLEIAKIHRGNFAKLLKNTKQNGTPDIKENLVKKIKFEKMIFSAGSIVVFSSNCPHRSSKNRSKFKRGSLYYTYNPKKFGNNYIKYFEDKSSSQNNQSKSLSGEID